MSRDYDVYPLMIDAQPGIVYHSSSQTAFVNCTILADHGQANLVITPKDAICS